MTDHALATSKRQERSFAIFFLDLDNFKHINDSYGHAVGDEILMAVAKRIAENIRDEDTLGRYAGDEFVLLVENIAYENKADIVAKKIHAAFQHPFQLSTQKIKMTLSMGISLFPNHGDSIKILLKNADTAMYQAKKAGRNRFVFYQQANIKAKWSPIKAFTPKLSLFGNKSV